MNQLNAQKVAQEVTHVIRDLDHLYVVILIRQNGEREVLVKVKGGHYAN